MCTQCFNYCEAWECDPSTPITASCFAVQSAQCSTVGTNCHVNALVGAGLCDLAYLVRAGAKVPAQAIKAQAQVATAKTNSYTWIAIAALAIVGFLVFAWRR